MERKSIFFLKITVIAMAVFLIVGFVILIFAVINGLNNNNKIKNTPQHNIGKLAEQLKLNKVSKFDINIDIDPGTIVSQIELSDNNMAIHLTKDDKDEIIIININRGEVLGRLKLK